MKKTILSIRCKENCWKIIDCVPESIEINRPWAALKKIVSDHYHLMIFRICRTLIRKLL